MPPLAALPEVLVEVPAEVLVEVPVEVLVEVPLAVLLAEPGPVLVVVAPPALVEPTLPGPVEAAPPAPLVDGLLVPELVLSLPQPETNVAIARKAKVRVRMLRDYASIGRCVKELWITE